MKTGTCHFLTYTCARNYYAKQGDGRSEVDLKIKEKSIVIGAPKVKKGQKLSVDSDGRYIIED